MIPKEKELNLIAIYLIVCDLYDQKTLFLLSMFQ